MGCVDRVRRRGEGGGNQAWEEKSFSTFLLLYSIPNGAKAGQPLTGALIQALRKQSILVLCLGSGIHSTQHLTQKMVCGTISS